MKVQVKKSPAHRKREQAAEDDPGTMRKSSDKEQKEPLCSAVRED